MTLIAGLIAFAAVEWQIRVEKQARKEEGARQKRAVAKAILFEIDDFYRSQVQGVGGYLDGFARKRELCEVVRVPPSLFTVYQANTARLGDLPDEAVEAIVHFYTKAAKFLALREDYRAEREDHSELALDHPDNRKATTLFGHMRDSLPVIAQAAYIACEKLCSIAGVGFKVPTVAVAREDIAALNRAIERIEHEPIHRI